MAARYGLTRRQRQVLLVVQELCAAGHPPTSGQIGAELDIRGAGRVYQILCALRRGGWIDWHPDDPSSLLVKVPLPEPREAKFVGVFEAPDLVAEDAA